MTISPRLQASSVALIADHLERQRAPELARLVAPRRAPTLPRVTSALLDEDLGALEAAVSDLEPEGAGVPVLLRRYLELGARHLAMSEDPAFGGALDALMLLDLQEPGAGGSRLLERLLRPARKRRPPRVPVAA